MNRKLRRAHKRRAGFRKPLPAWLTSGYALTVWFEDDAIGDILKRSDAEALRSD